MGVDKFCLMALESELMPPLTAIASKCVTVRVNVRVLGWREGALDSKEQFPALKLCCNASDS